MKAKQKPDTPATKAEAVEKVIKARAAAIGIDPKKVFVGVVGAKPEAKPQTAPAPAAKPAEKAKPDKPATPADKPAAPAAPSDEETGRAWRDMAKRHAAEMAALGVAVSPPKGVPCLRFVSGLYVPVAKAADYRATVDRHREERAKMRDVPATARGVYREELRTFKGDEIAALYELGLPHIADKGGVAVPVIRGNRALAEAWRSALEEVAPGKVSQIVTVRALGKPKPADKPKQTAQAPAVQADRPKGMGMVAKIEAKAAAKPAKAKPKK